MGEMILHKIMKPDKIHFRISREDTLLEDTLLKDTKRSVLRCHWDGLHTSRSFTAYLNIQTGFSLLF